ncbi:Hypothetical predicted protein [Cloeon dipterum]|uniref:Uncharacterized protein n=1 Tax=Cloeon dipterum TaxID=197152 RepID=A0A8S1E485_9INSE|nr:Hypothetical predicted protein [Cloeon dipterum]
MNLEDLVDARDWTGGEEVAESKIRSSEDPGDRRNGSTRRSRRWRRPGRTRQRWQRWSRWRRRERCRRRSGRRGVRLEEAAKAATEAASSVKMLEVAARDEAGAVVESRVREPGTQEAR